MKGFRKVPKIGTQAPDLLYISVGVAFEERWVVAQQQIHGLSWRPSACTC